MAEFKAFAGLRNDVSSERFGPGDLARADNVNLDATGKLSRRAGRTKVLAGDAHSLWAHGDLCLFASGDALRRLHPDYTSEVLRTGLTAGARISYCAVNGRTYWSNGFETGVIEQGRARSWGLASPTAQGTAHAVIGHLPAGTYQWAVTYLRDDGQESGTAVAGRIDLASDNAGIYFDDLPVSADAGVAAKVLYLSECNGAVLYEATTLLPAATTTMVIAPGNAALPLQTQFLQAPPAGQIVAYYRGRLFVASGNILYYSEPHAFEHFDLRHYLPFDGPITLVAPLEHDQKGGLAVATDTETMWLAGNSPEDFTHTPLAAEGAVPGTLTYVPGTLVGDGKLGADEFPMWLGTAGVCLATLDGQLVNLTRERYRAELTGTGAALFMPDEGRYLAVINH